MNVSKDREADVDHLIQDIVEKLEANRPVLVKSLRFGRLIWRHKNGKTEVDLEPKL